jgi:hypothetical protein
MSEALHAGSGFPTSANLTEAGFIPGNPKFSKESDFIVPFLLDRP